MRTAAISIGAGHVLVTFLTVVAARPLGAQAPDPSRIGEIAATRLGMTQVHQILAMPGRHVAVIGSGREMAALLDDRLRVTATFSGAGEGTIAGIPRSGIVGDSLWLAVPLSTELLILDNAGKIARRVRSNQALVLRTGEDAPVVPPGSMMGPIALGLLPQDGLIMQVMSPPNMPVPPGWQRIGKATSAMVRVDSRGVIQDFIQWLPADERCQFISRRLPFCRHIVRANAPDGSRFATITVDSMPHGDSVEVTSVMRQADGAVLYTRTDRWAGAPLSREALDSALSRISPSQRGRITSESVDSLRHAYQPRFLPPVERAVIDLDGRLWIELVRADDSARRYRVVDASGHTATMLRFPADVRIFAAGDGVAWGIASTDGAAKVVAFAI